MQLFEAIHLAFWIESTVGHMCDADTREDMRQAVLDASYAAYLRDDDGEEYDPPLAFSGSPILMYDTHKVLA